MVRCRSFPKSLLAALPLHLATLGQLPTYGQQPPGEPIDEGIADRGPLTESLRIIQPGLAQPRQFEQVYRIIGPEGPMLMRASGGLYAVFPRSDYVITRRGTQPAVPPGTVFYIGGLPEAFQAPRPLGPLPEHLIVPERLDRREATLIDTQIRSLLVPEMAEDRDQSAARPALGGRPIATLDEPGSRAQMSRANEADNVAATIVNDEAYRARRVRELLRIASAAERHHAQ